MNKLYKYKKYLKIVYMNKLFILEIFFISAVIRFCILIFPFRKIMQFLGSEEKETSSYENNGNLLKAYNIAYIVKLVSKITLWKSNCLVQATTVQFLLKKCKIQSTIYLGVAKNKAGKMFAHSWLRCGNEILTGKENKQCFVCVGYFGFFT